MDRSTYVDAARAAREALQRARAAQRAGKLRPLDRDVLDGCLELISLYSRTSDDVGARQLAALVYDVDEPTGHQRGRVSASLRRLRDADVINLDVERGRYGRTVITFPIQTSAPAPVEPPQSSASAPDEPLNLARIDAQSGATGGPLREEFREESARARFGDLFARRPNIERAEIDDALERLAAVPDEILDRAIAEVDGKRCWPRDIVERALELHRATRRERPPCTTCGGRGVVLIDGSTARQCDECKPSTNGQAVSALERGLGARRVRAS